MTAQEQPDQFIKIKQEISELIDLCQERGVRISAVKSILQNNGQSLSNSWQGLAAKIFKYSTISKIMLEKLKADLDSFVENHIRFTDKSIRIHVFDNTNFQNAYTTFINKFSQNPDSEIVFEENELAVYDNFKKNELSWFIFSTHRTYFERQKISAEEFASEDRYHEYDDVFGIKKIQVSCFDAVIFDHATKSVILSIDLASNFPLEAIHNAAAKLTLVANKLLKSEKASVRIPDNGENIFNCVPQLYVEKEGKISEINFCTTDGTTHHEKLTSVRKDLRETLYHKHGAEKTQLTVYRIGKKYTSSSKNEIEIFLPGSYRSLQNIHGASLFDAFFRECYSVADFSTLLNVILQNYSRNKKK